MLRLATPEQIPALKAIWAAGFPDDSSAVIDEMFGRLFRPEDCMVYMEEEKPVSMAFMLPAVYHSGGERYAAQYIYAAATLPAYRGRGIFGTLLQRAHALARERGQVASFLRPGEPSLAAYYRRFGYREWFRVQRLSLTSEQMTAQGNAAGLALTRGCTEYGALRARLLRKWDAWIEWDERVARQAVASAEESGGGLLLGHDGCALCEKLDDVVIARELLCPPERFADYCRAIGENFPGKAYALYLPATDRAAGEDFAMWCPLSEAVEQPCGIPYMGLSLE